MRAATAFAASMAGPAAAAATVSAHHESVDRTSQSPKNIPRGSQG